MDVWGSYGGGHAAPVMCQREFQKQGFILSSHMKFQEGVEEEFGFLRAA